MARQRYYISATNDIEELRKQLNANLEKMSRDIDAMRGLDGHPVQLHADLNLNGYKVRNVGPAADSKDLPTLGQMQKLAVMPVAGEIVINEPVTFTKPVHHKHHVYHHVRTHHPLGASRHEQVWELIGWNESYFPAGVRFSAHGYAVQNLITGTIVPSLFIQSAEVFTDSFTLTFGWFSSGNLDMFIDSGTAGGAGQNGYLYRMNMLNGQHPGQIYRVDNGALTDVSTYDVAANAGNLTAAWRRVSMKWNGAGANIEVIRMGGTRIAHAADATYTPNAPIGYGYESAECRFRDFLYHDVYAYTEP